MVVAHHVRPKENNLKEHPALTCSREKNGAAKDCSLSLWSLLLKMKRWEVRYSRPVLLPRISGGSDPPNSIVTWSQKRMMLQEHTHHYLTLLAVYMFT
ncbi:hypothetical protein E2C01_002769 [Portunus trituberculatus]|uniref:Uncharacterized protein n=1 Tax=Portunus trituberculatus TaxID=210409 RepID=A0A5B7CKT1_PORTR|nr:hypothetical protein [Portunus trituberculatus]